MVRTMTVVGVALTVATAMVDPAFAQDQQRLGMKEYLDQVSAAAASDGFADAGMDLSGALSASETEGRAVHLEAGRDYSFLGACDNACGDIDLELYDAAGNEVDSDLEYDDVPIVTVTPEQSGEFRVVIGVVDCSTENCQYAVRVLSRPAREPAEHVQVVMRQLDAYNTRMLEAGNQRTHGYRLNSLNQAEHAEFLVRLKAGTSYGIAGFCDADCSDLDVAVFSDGTEPVAQDVEADDHPAMSIVVTGTGVFRIRVTMASCATEPCVYGVALHGRPTEAKQLPDPEAGPASVQAPIDPT